MTRKEQVILLALGFIAFGLYLKSRRDCGGVCQQVANRFVASGIKSLL